MAFWLHHVTSSDVEIFKWQFLEQAYLTPLSYEQGQRFNHLTGDLELGDIRTDKVKSLQIGRAHV